MKLLITLARIPDASSGYYSTFALFLMGEGDYKVVEVEGESEEEIMDKVLLDNPKYVAVKYRLADDRITYT